MQHKRFSLAALVVAISLTATACSGGGGASGEMAKPPKDPGEVSGTIKVLTNRTDLVQNGTMKKYAAAFNKTYPKVKVKFEAITDYEGEVKIRMNTEDYGDVLLIPNDMKKSNYPQFFAPLGSADEMRKKYRFADKTEVGGKVHGIAMFGNADGIVYNKALWKRAGIKGWPSTPGEFVKDLQKVKAQTDAVPYYTNFKDGWPLTNLTNSVGSVSCDRKAYEKLAATPSPWHQGGDLQVIDKLLYDVVHDKLAEKDPTTTNWEESKNQLAQGRIGSMMLGSWSLSQFRAAAKQSGKDPSAIGFMPFPSKRKGSHCATLSSDYQQAVNAHSEHKEAARAWIDWFTEKSGYVQQEGGVPAVRSAELPDSLNPYVDRGVKFVERSEAKTEKVNNIDNASEIGLTKEDYRQELVDIARGAKSGDAKGYFEDLDKRWAEAAETAG